MKKIRLKNLNGFISFYIRNKSTISSNSEQASKLSITPAAWPGSRL